VAEKESSFSYSPEYFGAVIAFVLPGFLGLWLLATVDSGSPAAVWLSTAQDKQTVGAFLFAGLASLGFGIILSGIRWLIFEASGLLTLLGVPARVAVDHRTRKENEAAYREITENHYKFYLFYANTSTAVLLLLPVLWDRMSKGTVIAVALLEVVLIACARDAIIRHRTKEQILLGVYEPKKKTA
jgi:hypothetical protein